jgi:hypothetical protein
MVHSSLEKFFREDAMSAKESRTEMGRRLAQKKRIKNFTAKAP